MGENGRFVEAFQCNDCGSHEVGDVHVSDTPGAGLEGHCVHCGHVVRVRVSSTWVRRAGLPSVRAEPTPLEVAFGILNDPRTDIVTRVISVLEDAGFHDEEFCDGPDDLVREVRHVCDLASLYLDIRNALSKELL